MPIVYLRDGKRRGYFPIEFFFQAFSKTRETDFNQEVLKFNDEMSSTHKLQHLQKIKEKVDGIKRQSAPYLEDLLRELRLDRVDREPLELSATVLEQPKITFDNKENTPFDGSWDLRDVRFSKPAFLSSFGILDFTSDGRAASNILDLIQTLGRHGVKMPQNVDIEDAVRNVTVLVNSSRPEEIYQKFTEARDLAQQYFLTKNQGILRFGGFMSQVLNGDTGEIADGIFHPMDDIGKDFSVILRQDLLMETHIIEYQGNEQPARINAVVDNGDYVDLFKLRYNPGNRGYERQEEDSERWNSCRFDDRYVFRTQDNWDSKAFDEKQVDIKRACVVVDLKKIDCPSIIFVRLRDNSSEVYNFIKLLSNNIVGTQSQCFLAQKYKPGQYASNVAIKVNAKLSSKTTGAKAWSVSLGNMQNSWLQETPTMIMGLSLARAAGQDQRTVVAGSVCLDANEYPGIQMAQAVRVQKAAGIIERSSLEHITKSLAMQYYLHNTTRDSNGNNYNIFPNRVLVYRNGSSEETFGELMESEVLVIRQAFYDLIQKLQPRGWTSSIGNDKPSHLNTPIITYIVAVSQHNIRVVPAVEAFKKGGRQIMNVPSGTCVNHTITDYLDGERSALPKEAVEGGANVFEPSDYDGFDFLLTSQGGLKGTSKPIFYRTIYNENYVWKPEKEDSSRVTQLTKQKLQQITYSMTFQYGTATKAVRMVPVIKYSVRLASTFVSYLPYITGRHGLSALEEFQLREDVQEDKSTFGYRKLSNTSDECIKTETMEYFSPFSADLCEPKTPFHPHMMA
eukprot:CAMPEP_0194179776 /NCGR_PEP_ID=MMETSP0154-20130528/13179_1 /TAXON_ID=1049557 /ORGANISM="Thalassiothrix antarctica, Strain L6-D1" /LENGTH=790 /DNA_ID=CAMNT_0038895255 /DNA_START=366 /DNA_END=2738 /DNA_ORIENTATION=+